MIKKLSVAISALLLLVSGAVGQSLVVEVPPYTYANITLAAPTTTTLKATPGILHSICVNTPANTGTATVYDGTATQAVVIAVITEYTGVAVCYLYDVNLINGLTVVTATAAGNLTVSYR